MRKIRWVLYGIITILVLISFYTYQKATDTTYRGMSIIPEQYKDIPLFKGLNPKEHNYTMKNNRWIEIYDFYSKELPKYGWQVEYIDSAPRDNDSENDWSGFMSRWRKEGFDGVLWVSAHYNQSEKQTEVIFDKTPIYNSTAWIDKIPESIRIYQSPSDDKGSEIKDITKIEEIARFINQAIDWNESPESLNQSKIVEFGNMKIEVVFENNKGIYLQSQKGVKWLKPESEFLKQLDFIQ